MEVKICGITKPDQAVAISQLGATALGFICVQASPRYILPAQIRSIVEKVPMTVEKIGVFANANIESICAIADTANLTGIQLHGDESPQFCQELGISTSGIKVIKAFRIRDGLDLNLIDNYTNYVDTFLLDAYHPQQLGGTGKTLDWQILHNFHSGRPWWLAGGINPDNVIDAIQATNPHGIDLSSGVEISPGNKDLSKVNRLFHLLKSPR